MMCERFGPFAFGIALQRENGRRRSLSGAGACLAFPAGGARTARQRRRRPFQFHVEIRLP
jgi:hypothetical protein